jgi:hypothetical protein
LNAGKNNDSLPYPGNGKTVIESKPPSQGRADSIRGLIKEE